MPLFNTPSSFGSVTRSLHWLTAVLIFANLALGLGADQAPFDTAQALARKTQLFSVHKTLGVSLFFVAVLRVVLGLVQTRPAPLGVSRPSQQRLADLIHWLLYGTLIVVPLSGWVHHAASEGFAPILWPFGQSLPMIAKSQTLFETTGTVHRVFVYLMMFAVALHLAGAFKHAVLDRDGTLLRMLLGRSEETTQTPHKRPLTPPLVAITMLLAALVTGWAVGTTDRSGQLHPKDLPFSQTAAWTVTEGALEITILQMGTKVTGQFENWSADISFDPPQGTGPAGHVLVTIDIASLKLGAVATQAMGPDYFDVDQFPTATFDAQINATDENYVAVGSLSIKGHTHPIRLPFSMQLDGVTANMEASLTLNRGDFDIGLTRHDATQLGLDVIVDVALTARRKD